jgi:hypothetical protein
MYPQAVPLLRQGVPRVRLAGIYLQSFPGVRTVAEIWNVEPDAPFATKKVTFDFGIYPWFTNATGGKL